MCFTQEKIIHGLGEYSASQAVGHSSHGILGNGVLQMLEKAMQKQGVVG